MEENLVANKVQEAFSNCQQLQYNLIKLAELLKTFYNTCKDDEEKAVAFLTAFSHCVECAFLTNYPNECADRCTEFAALFSSLFYKNDESDEDITDEEEENFFDIFLSHIISLKFHSHSKKVVRFRVCQLVFRLLTSIPADAALDEDMLDQCGKAMLYRINDKVPSVRVQAARALSRIQQPRYKDCAIINAYIFHLQCDDSVQVRCAVLSNISLNTKTLPVVLGRVYDVSRQVRKLAYEVIAHKVSISALTNEQRLHLVKQGLLDPSEAVQNVVKKVLFQNWLISFDGNILKLLEKLDVIGAFETSRRAILAIFEYSSLDDLKSGFSLVNEEKVVPFEKLTPESAVYWFQITEYFRSHGVKGESCLESILPSLYTFAEYIENYFVDCLGPFVSQFNDINGLPADVDDEKIEKEFVAEQLLKMVLKMDFSDNAGLKRINEMIKNQINSLDVFLFPCLMSPLAKALVMVNSFNSSSVDNIDDQKVQLIAKIISELQEPLMATQQPDMITAEEIMNCKTELLKLNKDIEDAKTKLQAEKEKGDFELAAHTELLIENMEAQVFHLNEKIEKGPTECSQQSQPDSQQTNPDELPTEQYSPGLLVKCLKLLIELTASIFESYCTHKQRKKMDLHPTVLQFVQDLIIPSIMNTSPIVREEGIKALGICCMFSNSHASAHIALFMQVAQMDICSVRVKAIQSISDLIRMFTVKSLVYTKPTSENNEDVEEYDDEEVKSNLMRKFLDMLEDEDLEVREAVVQLFTRVLISHHILSATVLSRLLLLWHDPAVKADLSIVNDISTFLNIFPYMSKASHECLEAAILPTLRVLFEAPETSSLAAVNIDKVVELLVTMTRPSVIKSADLVGICQPDTSWLKDGSAHDNLGVMIANEVLSNPTSPYVSSLCRALPLLELNPDLQSNLHDLTVLCENLIIDVKDKSALKYITKFQLKIKEVSETEDTITNLVTSNLENCNLDTTSVNNNLSKTINESSLFNNETVLKPSDQNVQMPCDAFDTPPASKRSMRRNPKRNLSQAILEVSD